MCELHCDTVITEKKREKEKEKGVRKRYLKKKTCRPKLLEKKVRWHVDSWKPLKPLHKKERIVIFLPHANHIQTLLALLALHSGTTFLLFLTHKVLVHPPPFLRDTYHHHLYAQTLARRPRPTRVHTGGWGAPALKPNRDGDQAQRWNINRLYAAQETGLEQHERTTIWYPPDRTIGEILRQILPVRKSFPELELLERYYDKYS